MGIDAMMFVRTREKIGESRLKQIAWEMCAVFGRTHFFIDRKTEKRALSLSTQYEQDGPTIEAPAGEVFVEVSLWSRYWGPGYERGDLALLITLAEWLERKFPNGQVWYGGDSSGVEARHFDVKMRKEFLDHAASADGFAYRLSDRGSERCDFCEAPMSECRWGGLGTGSVCLGCGLHRLVNGSHKTEAVGHWPDEERKAVST